MKAVEPWVLTDTRLGASTNSSTSNPAMLAGIRYHKRFYKGLRVHVDLSLPGWTLFVEPWFKASKSQKLRSPDSVLINRELGKAVVIEVKKNWQDGRDVKLLTEYLPIVASAFGLESFPLMVVGNVRGLRHEPLKSMSEIIDVPLAWLPGQPTPTLLKL